MIYPSSPHLFESNQTKPDAGVPGCLPFAYFNFCECREPRRLPAPAASRKAGRYGRDDGGRRQCTGSLSSEQYAPARRAELGGHHHRWQHPVATHAFPCLPCLHARGASLTLPPKAPERLGLAALARPPVLTTQCHPLNPPATVVRQKKQTKHADGPRPRGPHGRSASGACQGLQPLLHGALGRHIHAPLRRLGRAVRGAESPSDSLLRLRSRSRPRLLRRRRSTTCSTG